jgi:hypothetical protein
LIDTDDAHYIGHGKYLLYILCLVGISIFGFLSISFSPNNQREITEAGGTLAVLLMVISGVLVAIYGYQELSNEEKTYEIISPTA